MSEADKLIRRLALRGRRMIRTGTVVLDLLHLEELCILAKAAIKKEAYNRKYLRTALDIINGIAYYLTLQNRRKVLMGFIRTYVDISVLTFSE
ncbi:hypothetical protein Z3_74 [Bacillus phage Z3]|nr:hypothetical protein Z3_74 [Bacillus phage Z3]